MSEETIVNVTEGYTEAANRDKAVSAFDTVTSADSRAGLASLVTVETLTVDINLAVVGVACGWGVDALTALKEETIWAGEARVIGDIAAGQTTLVTRKTNSVDLDKTLIVCAVIRSLNASASLENERVEARSTIKV